MQGNPATENQRIHRGRYGPAGGGFKAAAALQHTTPERALAGMLAKHIVSLYDMCFDGDTDYDISTWNEKDYRQPQLSVLTESYYKGGTYQSTKLK